MTSELKHPVPLRYKCSYCNNPDNGFWVIPPTDLYTKPTSERKSSFELTKTVKMTIECPNPICRQVNTIFWDKS